MIRINLLGSEIVDNSPKKLWIGGYLGSVGLFLSIFVVLYLWTSSEVSSLAIRKKSLEQEVARLKEKTKEVRDLERMRGDLNNKLAIIATLKKSKTGPVRILDDINVAIPERSWVIDFAEKGGILSLNGMAIDLTTISTFAKALERSKYFKKPEIAQAIEKDKDGVPVQAFTIRSQISYSGHFEQVVKEESDKKGKKGK